MLTVGIDEATSDEAIAAAEAHEVVFAAVGRHPNGAARVRRLRRRRGSRSWRCIRGSWRSARPASTTTATARRREDQRRAFRAQIEIARRVDKPLVIHVRDTATTTDGAALDQTFEMLARRGRPGSA